nr:mucin-3B-like [Labrus bergylta]
MEEYYKTRIENVKEVVVISVSPGSPLGRLSTNTVEEIQLRVEGTDLTPTRVGVNVKHDVILAIPNNPDYEDIYVNNTEEITEAVGDLVGCTLDCPSFNVTVKPTVTPTEPDLQSVCERLNEDADVTDFYQAAEVNNKVTCVTACHPKHDKHKTCYNKGVCKVFKATGPLCHCVDLSSTWYLSDDCRLPIHRTAFFAGLSVTLTVLLVLVGVLAAFVLRNKQRRYKDIKDQLVNQWLNEDFEWSRSNIDEVYGNPTFTQSEATVHLEDLDAYRQPLPAYQPTRPSSQIDYRQSAGMFPPSRQAHRHITPSNISGYSQSAGPVNSETQSTSR